MKSDLIAPPDYSRYYGNLSSKYLNSKNQFIWPKPPDDKVFQNKIGKLEQVKKEIYRFYKSYFKMSENLDLEIILGGCITSIFFYVNSRKMEDELNSEIDHNKSLTYSKQNLSFFWSDLRAKFQTRSFANFVTHLMRSTNELSNIGQEITPFENKNMALKRYAKNLYFKFSLLKRNQVLGFRYNNNKFFETILDAYYKPNIQRADQEFRMILFEKLVSAFTSERDFSTEAKLIPLLLPAVFAEYFYDALMSCENWAKMKPKSKIYDVTTFWNSDIARMYIAVSKRAHCSKFLIERHGGGYHLGRWFARDWENKIADTILPYKLPRTLLRKTSNKNRSVLIIGTVSDFIRVGVYSFLDPWQQTFKLLEDIVELTRIITPKFKVYFRPHRNDYGWGILKGLQNHCDIIDRGQSNDFYQDISSFEYVISTSDTTQFYESSILNPKTLGYFPDDFFEIRHKHEIFNAFRKEKLIFNNVPELAEHILKGSNKTNELDGVKNYALRSMGL